MYNKKKGGWVKGLGNGWGKERLNVLVMNKMIHPIYSQPQSTVSIVQLQENMSKQLNG